MSNEGVEESEILINAGLRCSEVSERIRVRRARPRDQAVVDVKDGKRTEGEDSRAVRAGGCHLSPPVSRLRYGGLEGEAYVDAGVFEGFEVLHCGRGCMRKGIEDVGEGCIVVMPRVIYSGMQ